MRAALLMLVFLGGLAGLCLIANVFIRAMNPDEYPPRTRRAKLRADLEHERDQAEQLRTSNAVLVAMLHEARMTLQQIAKTANSEDDRLLAGDRADQIGEFLIDHASKPGGEVSMSS